MPPSLLHRSRVRRGRLFRTLSVALLFAAHTVAQNPPSFIQSSVSVGLAGRVDYSKVTNRLVFDAPNRLTPNNFFAVYTSSPGGGSKVCLTCSAPIPQGQNGDPVWSPSGKYILFQVQDTNLPLVPPAPNPYKLTNPGYGENNNLWIMNSGGTEFYQLTRISAGMAVLHPQWSHNGQLILWSEKIGSVGADGQWTMHLANVTWTAFGPSLTNIRSIAPMGTDTFYETSCFSADDSHILFTAGSPSLSQMNIYQYDLTTGAILALTNPTNPFTVEWNEFGKYAPDGRIVWASSRNVATVRNYYIPYADYWVMNADGSNQTRLSYYNQAGYPEYYPDGLFTADYCFGPSSQYIFASLEENLITPPDTDMQYTLTSILLTGPI